MTFMKFPSGEEMHLDMAANQPRDKLGQFASTGGSGGGGAPSGGYESRDVNRVKAYQKTYQTNDNSLSPYKHRNTVATIQEGAIKNATPHPEIMKQDKSLSTGEIRKRAAGDTNLIMEHAKDNDIGGVLKYERFIAAHEATLQKRGESLL